MRTRSSSSPPMLQSNTPLHYTFNRYWNPNIPPNIGSWMDDPPAPDIPVDQDKVVSGDLSVISDEQVSAHRIKDVDHSMFRWSYTPSGPIEVKSQVSLQGNQGNYWNNLSGQYAAHAMLREGPTGWFSLPGEGNFVVSYAEDDASLMSKALHKFMDGNEVDNFTNIRESGQTVDMVRGLGDKWRSMLLWMPGRHLRGKNRIVPDWSRVKRFYSLFRSDQKGLTAKGRSLASIPVEISSGYLAYNFGVAPLVSDLKTMANRMSTLKADLQRNKFRGQRRIAHAICPGSIACSNMGMYYFAPVGTPDPTTARLKLDYSVGSLRKVATVQGMDSTQWNTDIFRNLDYIGKRFLSAGPGSALWEAIPYSFVLDWFVNSSQVLDSIDNTLTGGKKRVTDGCISTKVDVEARVLYSPERAALQSPQSFYCSFDGSEYGKVSMKHYHRERALPSFWVGKSGRFGKKQGSLLAALLHTRVANLKLLAK